MSSRATLSDVDQRSASPPRSTVQSAACRLAGRVIAVVLFPSTTFASGSTSSARITPAMERVTTATTRTFCANTKGARSTSQMPLRPPVKERALSGGDCLFAVIRYWASLSVSRPRKPRGTPVTCNASDCVVDVAGGCWRDAWRRVPGPRRRRRDVTNRLAGPAQSVF